MMSRNDSKMRPSVLDDGQTVGECLDRGEDVALDLEGLQAPSTKQHKMGLQSTNQHPMPMVAKHRTLID